MNTTTNQKILVTGASGKLGRQIVTRLLGAGHTVVATSRRADTLDDLANSAASYSGRLELVTCDLGGGGGARLAADLVGRDLMPDAIVNNAVDLSNQQLPSDGKPTFAQWQTEFDMAVIAPFQLVAAIADVSGSRLKAVVNIASMYGVVPRNPSLYDDPLHQSPIHYGVAKAAMIHLTKELAVRLAPKVRVNAVSFGGVEGRVSDAFKQRYARLAPMGRMLQDTEVPGSVAFLLSDDAAMITGQNLIVDGGWTTW